MSALRLSALRLSALRLSALPDRLRAVFRQTDIRVALIVTLALRLWTSVFIVILLAVAPGPYAASWQFVFHQPPGTKITVYPHPVLVGAPSLLTTPWIHWDAVYYVLLATRGYVPGDGAFLPLYPGLAHLAGLALGGRFIAGALLISTVTTFFTLLLLYRLALRLGASQRAATYTLAVAATLPLAFYFVAPYAEALFLAFSLAAILATFDAHWGRAALFAIAASLTRQQGPLLGLLALPALVAAFALLARGEYPTLRQRLRAVWAAARGPLLLLVSGAVAYLCWLFVLLRLLGGATPFALLTSSSGWGQHFTAPGPAVLADLAALWRDPITAVTTLGHYALDVAAALLGLVGLVLTVRRIPSALWLYIAGCWCIALIKVDSDGHTASAARYLLALLPLLVLPAAQLACARLLPRLVYFAASLGLFGWYFGQWLLWGWVS